MSAWVIYRGPLERSRLSFLLETFAKQYGSVNFIWIFPGVMTEQRLSAYHSYINTQPIASDHIIQAPLKSYFNTRSKIRAIIQNTDALICIGFSSLWFSSAVKFKKLIWCINGIPEEKELTSKFPRIITHINWFICKLFSKPELIIVVSSGMRKLVETRMPGIAIFEAPTCVDISTFRKNGMFGKKYFTYLGTGAAWQALDLLSLLWQAIYVLDNTIMFRVISRDPRAKILSKNIPLQNIEFVSSDDFEKVAAWLNEAEVGFLVRRDTLVNRVSFPTKLAEYLAAGAWVVSSDFDWQVKEYVDKYQCGILINNVQHDSALNILQFRKEAVSSILEKNVAACADALDRQFWIGLLNQRLSQLS